jgi:glucose-6-phosphate dehydrogenase assembly protein OpcA
MTMAEHLRTVGTWSGQDVDAEAVQSQLTRLWRTAVDHAHQHEQPATARTNVLTLVAYAGTEQAATRVLDTVAALAEHHPSRTLLVRAEPGAAERTLSADVVTRCRLDRPQVCFEQIVLHAHGSTVEQVSSAVASLLLRDLPTYLWWPDDAGEQAALLRCLVPLCDGVVVDSARFADPVATLATVLDVAGQQPGGGIADLQWARLTGWRDGTAQFFDSGALRRYLDGITSVDLQVAARAAATLPWVGLFYVAWLADRLGWRPDPSARLEPATGQATLIAGRRPIGVTIRDTPDGSPATGLTAVRLSATIAGRTATFSIERGADDQVTTRTAEDGDPPIERALPLPVPDDAALLAEVLGYFRRDLIYEQTLRFLKDWLPEAARGRS